MCVYNAQQVVYIVHILNFFAKTQGMFSKHRENTGIRFSQMVNSLILKVKDIAIFAVKNHFFPQKLDRSAQSVLYM